MKSNLQCDRFTNAVLETDHLRVAQLEEAPSDSERRKLVGFITTGHYSMRLGYSYGIGAVSLIEWIKMNIESM